MIWIQTEPPKPVPFVVTLAATERKAKSVDPLTSDGDAKGWVTIESDHVVYRLDTGLIEDDGLRRTREVLDDLLSGRNPGGPIGSLGPDRLKSWSTILASGPLGRTGGAVRGALGFYASASIDLRFEDGTTESISAISPTEGKTLPPPSRRAIEEPELEPESPSFVFRYSPGFPRAMFKTVQAFALDALAARRAEVVDDLEKRLGDRLKEKLATTMAAPSRGYPTAGMLVDDMDPALRAALPASTRGKKIASVRPVLIVGMVTREGAFGFSALKFLR